MRPLILGTVVVAASVAAGVALRSTPADTTAAPQWNAKAAAAYLDYREAWWSTWPRAARDHGTFCVSCHTAVPYAISRDTLGKALGETAPSESELKLIENVTKRVRMWAEVEPFYKEDRDAYKPTESRGTESVLNALILSSHDHAGGQFSPDAQTAFKNMWALQLTLGEAKGAWNWLRFNNEPWEANDSQYYGAALAALAVGNAPASYRATPDIQENLKLLRDYLKREGPRQTAINRVMLLWASTGWPQLLSAYEQKVIMQEIISKQQPDGGWSLSSLVGAWKRVDGTPLDARSDGYATGLVVLVLEKFGLPPADSHLQDGLAWLGSHQDPADGHWPGYSLNKNRDLSTDIGRFMSDAATAYAVLALAQSKSQ